ncbi:MAG: hypothetical protein A2X78_00455 [Gammaproteobacteria bacterium GWE2_37_16]|nr:MAG: hypothetical protein A2X78_00455 [Gammaproteobacteria bacterium GWE2_37_16]
MSTGVLIGFLPWILFYILPLHTAQQLKVGITGLLLLTLVTSYKDLKRKFILPWVTLAFFVFSFVGVVMFDLEFLMSNMAILVNSALVCVALGSLAIGKPFTLQYARAEVAKEKWQHPVFIFINQVLTFVWGMSFLFNLSVNVIHKIHPYSNLIVSMLVNGSTLGALFFTIWFPKWYRNKITHKYK